MKNHENKVARIIVINPDGSIILHRRPDWSKQAANKLQMIGGKFEEIDTTRKHTAQREVYEELGLDKNIGEFLFFTTSENNGWMSFIFILLLSEQYDQNIMPDHGEFDSVEFVNQDSILKLIANDEIAFDHPAVLEQYLNIFS